MFLINTIEEDGWVKYELTDAIAGTIATIIPQCGALLHSFSAIKNGKTINIIEQYEDAADFEKNAENKGFKSSKLSPFVCRLKNGEYNWLDKTYKVEGFYLPPHAIHGLLYKESFTVTKTQATATFASIELLYEYKASDAGYPFHFNCIVSFTLSSGNRLNINTKINNQSLQAIPIADGWHPYFSFGQNVDDMLIEVNSNSMLVFDDSLIPTGELVPYSDFNTSKKLEATFFDNCFTLNNTIDAACVLKDEKNNLQLSILPIKNYPYLQIYTPPHRQSIAIENLSAAPDAFNNGIGLITLKEKESIEFEVAYIIA